MNAPAITTTAQTAAAPLPSHFNLAAALKDAALSALITLGLAIPIIAFKTEQNGADLFLSQRWGTVALFCALVFALRIFQHAFTASRAAREAAVNPRQATEAVDAAPNAFQRISKYGLPAFLGVALSFPLIIYLIQGGLNESRYWVDLGILILTYVMLGWGLNIVVGLFLDRIQGCGGVLHPRHRADLHALRHPRTA